MKTNSFKANSNLYKVKYLYRLIMYLLLPLLGGVLVSSCSENNNEPPTGNKETINANVSIEEYETKTEEIASILLGKDLTLNECAQVVNKIKDVESAQVKDSLVEVSIKNIGIILLDPLGVTLRGEEIDQAAIDVIDQGSQEGIKDFTDLLKEATEGSEIGETETETISENNDSDIEWDEFSFLDSSIPEKKDNASDNNLSLRSSLTVKAKTRATAGRVVLNKYNMAIWCPWSEFKSDIPNFKHAINASVKKSNMTIEITTLSGEPNSFGSFGLYDLVFISCHGTPAGQICVPKSYWNSYIKTYTVERDGKKYIDSSKAAQDGIITTFSKQGDKLIEQVSLGKKFFDKYLPSLSRTIIWTSACYLGRSGSEFLNSAISKRCADYFGADDKCSGTGKLL